MDGFCMMASTIYREIEMLNICRRIFLLTTLVMPMLTLNGCRRSSQDVWDDTKSCGRHVMRGFSALGGAQCDSRQIRNRDDFMPRQENNSSACSVRPYDPCVLEEYPSCELSMTECTAFTSKNILSSTDSGIPPLKSFCDPQYNSVFKNVLFPYNSDVIKGEEHRAAVKNMGEYLKKHRNVSVLIEGHCDQRGAEAYNLALGLRRANTVRKMLIQEGVDPVNLQTVSYGKERLLDMRSNEEGWSQNRRAQFKVYER